MATTLKTLVRTDKPPIVFVSYSHKDEAWKNALLPQLRNLEKLGTLEVWNDRDIKAGVDWYAEIKDVLSRTKVAICLISSNFLSSSFCLDEEVAYLLQARNRGDLEIIPVLVEDCVWQPHRWLKRLQMFPRDGQNVTTHFNDDPAQVFSDVANQIYKMLQLGYVFEHPPPPGEPPEKIDIDRLPQTGELLFGRREELDALDSIWHDKTLNVAVFKASGGVGKSSLVRAWVEDMALDNYRGARRVFAWSFYSQGTKERVTSADELISHALGWFGDETKGEGLSPWDRGQRLAELVREKRTLLLLDGLEPLQSGQAYDRGKIKDPGLEVLLDELGRSNPGLCLISTREEVSDLWHDRHACRVGQFDLDTISPTAGRALLRVSGVKGEDTALEQAVHDFGRHAYAVKLLGSFLTFCNTPHIKYAADIADLPKVEDKYGKHPRRVMVAFAERFGDSAKADILAMLGLFDRPADAGCIVALRKEPLVPGLNDAVLRISEAVWQETIGELRQLNLLAPKSRHAPDELDAHPLVREHFGLRDWRPDYWKAGHEILYEHLKKQAPHWPDTLAEMAPLFHAVHHGCQAGRLQEVLDEVYSSRILRGGVDYLTSRLGAFGTDLGLLASFFKIPFKEYAVDIQQPAGVRLLHDAAFSLRALGRLGEAKELVRNALNANVKGDEWKNASASASNLSELEMALGNLVEAKISAEDAVDYADLSNIDFERLARRTLLADVLHLMGESDAALKLFEEAEKMQQGLMPRNRQLCSVQGYNFCDLLLDFNQAQAVSERASHALNVAFRGSNRLLDIALGHLSLGRAALALGNQHEAVSRLSQAVGGLRESGHLENIPLGLLARAAFFREVEEYAKSRHDLDEVMRVATFRGMRLHECDAHLEYARLEIKQGQPDVARVHVTSAAKLVEDCGYHRRDGEVADLKEKLGL